MSTPIPETHIIAGHRSRGAAENGRERVVKLLLERNNVNPDSLCGPSQIMAQRGAEEGQTPLSLAAENGPEGIVKLLLGRKAVNLDSPSKSGRTPLSFAAGNGHEGIVKLLLERKEVNPNSLSKSSRKPHLSF